MKYNPAIHHRQSIRLPEYDYSQAGAYFITIVTHKRGCLFGEIADNVMNINDAGEICRKTWIELPNHNSNVAPDAFVVMPNHVHGIIMLMDSDAIAGADSESVQTVVNHRLSEIIRQFKTFSAKHINKLRKSLGVPVWQRNYWERVIRNEKELYCLREYIANNPLKWDNDEENIFKGH